MNKYRIAATFRPFAIAFIPVAFLLFAVKQNMMLGAWLLLGAVLAIYLRCPACGNGIYVDPKYPYRTLLAKPHKTCAKCGHAFK